MRIMLGLGTLLLLGAIAAACAFWAGADAGAPIAFALGGLLLCVVAPLGIGALGNWGVPGDEPRVSWRHGGGH